MPPLSLILFGQEMAMPCFLHAADIHLDSPLVGLERYEGAPVDEIRDATRRAFEKDHLPNMTGTPLAYHPKGSLSRTGGPADVNDDYEAWTPESA